MSESSFLLSCKLPFSNGGFFGGVFMGADNVENCIKLLTDMAEKLLASGEERYPKRSDFTDEQVVAIKAFLGPWPRALEKAGLKPVSDSYLQKAEKRRQKHKKGTVGRP